MMIRCPNCGYEGKGKKLGSSCLDLLVAIFLLCLGILPGIIYLAWQHGKAHRIVCPACGFKNVVRLPKSQRAQPPQSLLSRLQSPQALEPQLPQSLSSQLSSLPETEKSGVFTKQQIIILVVLACGVFCVLCGGGYVIISSERAYEQAIVLPTSVPLPTSTPLPTPTLPPFDPNSPQVFFDAVVRNVVKEYNTTDFSCEIMEELQLPSGNFALYVEVKIPQDSDLSVHSRIIFDTLKALYASTTPVGFVHVHIEYGEKCLCGAGMGRKASDGFNWVGSTPSDLIGFLSSVQDYGDGNLGSSSDSEQAAYYNAPRGTGCP